LDLALPKRLREGEAANVEIFSIFQQRIMLSKDLIVQLEEDFHNEGFGRVQILDAYSVSGGSINDCFQVKTNNGSFFLKVNSAITYPAMFETELKGLELLRAATELTVPKPLFFGELGKDAYLVMEHLETGPRSTEFWQNFGRSLAQLHRNTQDNFGLDHNNYIGSIPQSNNPHSSWAEFFIQERLEVQLKRACDRDKIGADVLLRMEKLFHRLDGLFPKEPPSLLHGDLWSGNFFSGADGKACIFDPAVYYGHREMDIGMSKLFGGFDPEFYNAYNTEWPIADDLEDRVDIANLYPLLVHVNLFGGGYLSQVRSILQRFT